MDVRCKSYKCRLTVQYSPFLLMMGSRVKNKDIFPTVYTFLVKQMFSDALTSHVNVTHTQMYFKPPFFFLYSNEAKIKNNFLYSLLGRIVLV